MMNIKQAEKDSKTFCVMPFVCALVNTNAQLGYCCVSDNRFGAKYKAGKDSILNMWSSDEVDDDRYNMLSGEKVKGCEMCYLQEKIGKISYRQKFNTEWIESNVNFTPIYLDLRLGSLCNLKCRMCNPFNSCVYAKEHFDLFSEDSDYRRIFKECYGENPEYLKDEDPWWDSSILWDEIISFIPKLEKVYMTGGEPTLIEQNYMFLRKCLEANRHDLNLFFNINCTVLKDEFLDLLKQFSRVKINASIDGVGKMNEYIRYPSNWNVIDRNFRKLAALKNIELGISPVVQIYNALHLSELLKYIEDVSNEYKKHINIDFLINVRPEYFDIRELPRDIRVIAKEKLENVKQMKIYRNHENIRNVVDSTQELMLLDDNDGKHISDFFIMTKLFDAKRNQSFKEYIPDLYQLLKEKYPNEI